MESHFLDSKDIAIIGRQKNVISLNYDKSIIITTDILKCIDGSKTYPPSIYIDNDLDHINLLAGDILLESTNSTSDYQSVVYGEKLVELLKWIIEVLKTHKHPPNAIAIPDFHYEANSRMFDMDSDLLNKRVKTR
jgi:hypothetical protein